MQVSAPGYEFARSLSIALCSNLIGHAVSCRPASRPASRRPAARRDRVTPIGFAAFAGSAPRASAARVLAAPRADAPEMRPRARRRMVGPALGLGWPGLAAGARTGARTRAGKPRPACAERGGRGAAPLTHYVETP